ncbi:MAG: alpha-glucosidase C-terminal domain-containing protein, partial [Gemmatimonadota bacterium]|nr:alpha-glucosidase C-terminal domain-containing protein [Gemmatimonadota bacterium]
ALRREDRSPIVEILAQTPPVPSQCQWAIFLRNHDELTLEMVTDEDRDYMYNEYAKDARMRINVGIRRRLAPLLDNGRRQIELMNALLLSMPGTPIIYYGDEIGMGDNVFLGDRNGVRTPMQWSGSWNAGFSDADSAALYFPLIVDAPYGYQGVNVHAQERTQTSLLRWMRRIIKVRKEYKAFGRGVFEMLLPENRKVLVYLRELENETILCVNNLSRFVQPVEIALDRFCEWTPVELFGKTEFPKIGDKPYFVTLGPHAFFWFELRPPGAKSGA